jgi:hypothetical protein
LITLAAAMSSVACGHYTCGTGANFGGSSCTAGSSGIGSNNNGGSATAAFVFVADSAGNGTNGTIDGYTLNTSASTFGATPTYTAPTTPFSDNGVGMVVAQSQYLYTGFPSTNQIYAWTIGADGSLATISGSPYSAPFMTFVGGGFLSQAIITNPAGTLLFFADNFNDVIYVYQIGSAGALTAATGSPFSVPFGGNMAIDGLGKYLYITDASSNHTGSQVAAYSINTSGGSLLTPVSGSPFPFPMWQVQGEPTGQYLIGTSGETVSVNGADDTHLYVYSIQQSGTAPGALTQVGTATSTRYSPLSIAAQSNTGGNVIYSFGVNDSDLAFNPIEAYSLGSTGGLTAVTGSPFSNVAEGSSGAFDQSGAFLFVYGGIVDSGTNTVTYQMGALNVGSDGSVTQPTSTLTLTSGGFFAVTDPI